MNDDLKAEIEKVVARRGPSDCFCESGLVIPRLLAALELAIKYLNRARESVHTNVKAQNNSRATERNVRALYDAAFVDEDAAILAALRGEA